MPPPPASAAHFPAGLSNADVEQAVRVSTSMTFARLLIYINIVCRDPLPDSPDRPWTRDLGGPCVSDIDAMFQLQCSNSWVSLAPRLKLRAKMSVEALL